MKIIDILNIWVTDRTKLPKKIKVENEVFEYDEGCKLYKALNEDYFLIQDYLDCVERLHKEVEVTEENKEIEELGFIEETVKYCDGTGHTNKVNNMASYSDIVISTNEYRPCFVFSQKALFHRWIIKHEMVYKDEYVKGLVEFENGHVAEVGKEDIQFCDNKFKEYNFKEREEK